MFFTTTCIYYTGTVCSKQLIFTVDGNERIFSQKKKMVLNIHGTIVILLDIVVTSYVERRRVGFLIHKDVHFSTYLCPEYMERDCGRGERMDLWSRLGGVGGSEEDTTL